jgi:CBS domain-containing protein/nucleotide-binding universal stress UspA family protein
MPEEEGPMMVKDWMSGSLITVTPETDVSAAWALMRERRVKHLLVVGDQRLVGILSDRDIRLVLPSPATTLSSWEINYRLANLRVDSIMTRSPVTIDPERSVSDAAALMLQRRIGALPVVEGHALRGIITQTDVLRAFPSSTDGPPQAAAEPPAPAAQHTILVPLDEAGDHARVLAAARSLAKRTPAGLRLLRVTPMPEAVIGSDGRTVSFSDQEAARVQYEVLRELREAAPDLWGVPVDYAVRFGETVEEIVREAEAADVDLIVMATHRRTGVQRLLRGSVAEDVERQTTRPVLLVPYDDDSAPDATAVLTTSGEQDA